MLGHTCLYEKHFGWQLLADGNACRGRGHWSDNAIHQCVWQCLLWVMDDMHTFTTVHTGCLLATVHLARRGRKLLLGDRYVPVGALSLEHALVIA
jgi:hypothetical protein